MFLLLLGEAFEALVGNRYRTILSLLGVAIGIASIIVVSSIATAGKAEIFKELETFGLRTFWVYRTTNSDTSVGVTLAGTGITTADYKALLNRTTPAISHISPVLDSNRFSNLASRRSKSMMVKLLGVNQVFHLINGDLLSHGRFFTMNDIHKRNNVAIIGSTVVEKLFPDSSLVIGQTISIGDHWFQVIGVLEEKSREFVASLGVAGAGGSNARILIPYTSYQKNLAEPDYVQFLQGQASQLDQAENAIQQTIALLKLRNNKALQYKGDNMASYVTTANNILQSVTFIGITAASVSLIVGGLAIMNIMSTSVIERTKEIGLRRAIGATQQAIRIQFILEAILISCAGGVLGTLMGLGTIHIASLYTTSPISVNYAGMLLATFSSFAVGLASGYYPALSAAKLEPVEALRHD